MFSVVMKIANCLRGPQVFLIDSLKGRIGLFFRKRFHFSVWSNSIQNDLAKMKFAINFLLFKYRVVALHSVQQCKTSLLAVKSLNGGQ